MKIMDMDSIEFEFYFYPVDSDIQLRRTETVVDYRVIRVSYVDLECTN
jgi:hypothetical protein